MSTKTFAYNSTKLNGYRPGDLGIADKLFEKQIKPIYESIKDPEEKEKFRQSMGPDKKMGIHAIERTVIASTMDLMRDFAELCKISLELFGHVEYINAILVGGANPETVASSYLRTFNSQLSQMNRFDTGIRTKSLTLTGTPPTFPGQDAAGAATAHTERVLTLLNGRLKTQLDTVKRRLADVHDFVGPVLIENSKKFFTMYDTSLRQRWSDDPERMKYWLDDRFLMDGAAHVSTGMFDVTGVCVNGVLTFKKGRHIQTGQAQNPILIQMLSFSAIPINFLDDVVKEYDGLRTSLSNVSNIATVYATFPRLNWLSNLLTKKKLIGYMGGSGEDFKTIPMFTRPPGDDGTIKPTVEAFERFVTDFMNAFISIANDCVNTQIARKIPGGH
jgi:hypothetical protein